MNQVLEILEAYRKTIALLNERTPSLGGEEHVATLREDHKRRRQRFADKYVVKESGQLIRRVPKRDKTMSGRQWRKTVKAARRTMKGEVA